MNKKYLGLFLVGCFSLVLTGCGGTDEKESDNNKVNNDKAAVLKCTQDMSADLSGLGTWTTDVEVKFDSAGKKVQSVDMGMLIALDKNEAVTDELVEQMKSSLESELCSSDTYSSCKVERNGRVVTVKATGGKEVIEESQDNDEDLESVKKGLEETGFTCSKE